MNIQMRDEHWFRTSDFPLAITISLFKPLKKVDRTDPRRACFIFEQDREIDELVEAFWRRDLKVEPRAFFDQIKALKSRLYEQS